MADSYVCNGNVTPNRFVKIDTSVTAPMVIQASAATDEIIGVSQIGTHNPPITGLNDGFAGIAGLGIKVWTVAEFAQIEAGGAFNSGDTLTSNGSGQAVAATSGNYVAGYARGTATAAGQLIEMKVQPYQG